MSARNNSVPRPLAKRALFIFVQLCFACNTYLSAGAMDEPLPEAMTNSAAATMDLSSSAKTFTASSTMAPTNITVGGAVVTVLPDQALTAAELIAVNQVLRTGNQYLQLNDVGVAIGGGFRLNPNLTNNISSLVVPEGVRVSQNAAILQSLNLAGNLVNNGTFNVFSTNPQVTSAVINANNIYNGATGVIASTLTNLTLNAINNIVNAGTMTSTGTLSLVAGNSIVNYGQVQALANLNMQAASIANAGTMVSTLGNLSLLTANIATSGALQAMAGRLTIQSLPAIANLQILNHDGVMSAAQELSLISNSATKSNLDLIGGILSGSTITFTAENGDVQVQAERINGGVYINGCNAAVGTLEGNLSIQNMNLTADPIYYAVSGDLDLTGLLSSTGGDDFVVLAGGNITSSDSPGTTVDAQGGEITFAAGVTFNVTGGASPISCSDCSSLFTITGTSSTGGNVDLGNINLVTSGSGNVTVIANAGNTNDGSVDIRSATAGSNVSITADSDITVGATASSAGDSFAATSNTANITINGDVSATNNIDLTASGSSSVISLATSKTISSTDGDITLTTPEANISGTITTAKDDGFLIIQSNDELTLGGNGTLEVTGDGYPTIYIAAGGNNPLTVSGSLTYNSCSVCYVQFISAATGGTVVFDANTTQTITGGAYIQAIAPQITFAGDASITNTDGYMDLTGYELATHITLADDSTVTLDMGSGMVFIGSYVSESLTIDKSAGANEATMLIESTVSTYSYGADQTITSSVTLASTQDMELNLDGGTLTNNGTITTSKSGGTITITSLESDLAIDGTGSVIATGENESAILVRTHGSGGETLTVDGALTFDAGSDGTTTFSAENMDVIGSSVTTVTGGAFAYFGQNVNLGAASEINGDDYVDFFASGGSNALTITCPDNASAVISAASGQISIHGTTVTFAKSTGSNSTTLYLNDSDFYCQSNEGNLTVNANVALESNMNVTLEANGGVAFNLNGTIRSTADDGQIDVSGTEGLTIGGSTTGTLEVTGTGSNYINIFGHNDGLTVNNSIVLDAGSGNEAIIGASSETMTVAANKDITFANGTKGKVQAKILILDGDNTITATATSGNAVTFFSPNPQPLTIKLEANTSSAVVSAGGIINFSSSKQIEFALNNGVTNDTVTFDLTGGTVSVIGNQDLTALHDGVIITADSDVNFSAEELTLGTDSQITTSSGSINLIADTGTLMIGDGAILYANEGNLLIQNNDTSAGAIEIGNGADLTAYTISAPTLGFVRIAIDTPPSSPTVGTNPGVTANESGGGLVYFGSGGITANGSGNVLNAKGRHVIFESGSLGAGAITLQGNVTITADPPELFNPQVSRASVSVVAPTTPTINATLAVPTDFTRPTLEVNVSRIRSIFETDISTTKKEYRSQCKKISYSPVNTDNSKVPARLCTSDVRGSKIKFVNSSDIFVDEDGRILVEAGETIVAPKDLAIVVAGDVTVIVEPSTIISVSRNDNCIKIHNLYEKGNHAVTAITAGKSISVGMGRELILSTSERASKVETNNDKFARRRIKDLGFVGNLHATSCEISLISLLEKHVALNALTHSHDIQDKSIVDKLVKTAACLMLTTNLHGAYSGK